MLKSLLEMIVEMICNKILYVLVAILLIGLGFFLCSVIPGLKILWVILVIIGDIFCISRAFD